MREAVVKFIMCKVLRFHSWEEWEEIGPRVSPIKAVHEGDIESRWCRRCLRIESRLPSSPAWVDLPSRNPVERLNIK